MTHAPKTNPAKLTAKQRTTLALQLRLQGKTFEAIAEEVGYKTHSGASNAIYRTLEKINQEIEQQIKQLRTQEHLRLESEIAMLNTIREKALSLHEELAQYLKGEKLLPDQRSLDQWLKLALDTSDRILKASQQLVNLWQLDQLPTTPAGSKPAITIITPINPIPPAAEARQPAPQETITSAKKPRPKP